MNNTKETILVVDDTQSNLALFDSLLKPIYIVKIALSGADALSLVSKAQPSLILLDIMMPDIDGYEVCRQLKANPETSHIPIIFVSAKDEVSDEVYGLSLGAVDYIHKPINNTILQARIKANLPDKIHLDQFSKIINKRDIELKKTNQKLDAAKQSIENSRMEMIKGLVRAAEFKDHDTGFHINRVADYSRLLAEKVTDDNIFIDMVYSAAPMHDIGKIGIPDNILLRRGSLTREEFEIMQTHTQIGASIIEPNQPGVLGMAYNIALTHHEKWDGSGYPEGLIGEQIPLEGRIVAVADVFDALTSTRPYKKSWSVEQAVELLSAQKNKHFDARLVTAFIEILPQITKIKVGYDKLLNNTEESLYEAL